MMKKNTVIVTLLAVLCVSLAFAGGGQAATPSAGASGASTDGTLKYKGTITMYAQAYSPDEPTVTQPNPPTMFREVAAKWQELHPGITIEFMPQLQAGQDYMTWLRARLAGGQAPDVYWAQYHELNSGSIPAGAYYKLNDILQRPNKYISGNLHWVDSFRPALMQQTAGPNGEINNIDADYVATLVVYNIAMFQQAGIDFTIKTWSDYTRACQMLKAAGFTPWVWSFANDNSSADTFTWLSRLFGTNLYFDDFEKLAVINGNDALALNPLEVAIAVKNGYFSPSDPRFIGWWPLIKEHVQNYMPQDAISPATTGQAVLNMFVNQQVAMMWNGNYIRKNIEAANIAWEYGGFPFPIPDTASLPMATSFDSSPAVGGPSGAFQYAISSPQANYTMNADKLEAVIDWLMFITTPENNATVVNDLGTLIPTIIGAQALPANASLMSLLEAEPKVIDVGPLQLGSEAMHSYYREFQAYAQGNQTLEQAGQNVMIVFNRAADDIIARSGVDVTPYLTK